MNTALSMQRPETMPVGGAILASAAPTGAAALNNAVAARPAASAKTDHSFNFSDVLAVINPLQHIPVVGTLYREWTGDTISPAARIAGDTLYGGVIGLAASVADSLVEGTTGKDIGSHIYDTLFGEDTPAAPAVNTPTAAASAAATGTPANTITLNAPTASGQSGFMAQMQQSTGHKHVVPLTTSMPVANAHPGEQATTNAALAQAEAANAALDSAAQKAINAYGAAGSPPVAPAPSQLQTQPTTQNATPTALPASPVSNPLAALPQDGISNMMLQALDKYKTMAKQNGVSGSTVSLTN